MSEHDLAEISEHVFTSSAVLEWWANPQTLLESVEVAVAVQFGPQGWTARGELASPEDHDGLEFFTELDQAWQLRLPDGSTFDVIVTKIDGVRFDLTEFRG